MSHETPPRATSLTTAPLFSPSSSCSSLDSIDSLDSPRPSTPPTQHPHLLSDPRQVTAEHVVHGEMRVERVKVEVMKGLDDRFVVCLVANVVLIPMAGAVGAAWARVVTEVLILVLLVAYFGLARLQRLPTRR